MISASKKPETIDEYIAMHPEKVQILLHKIRNIIKNAAPDAIEAMKYQLPTFVLHGNLVHLGAFKNYIGLYPAPSGIKVFKEELSIYESGKGSIKFPFDDEIPFDLIGQIVKFRAKENFEKVNAKVRNHVKK
ncbi:MAG: hypothetical protein FJY21_00410 [Bacteroidetes bacterium]|nr:hypothetical protein [Bacteroidota bacterium]